MRLSSIIPLGLLVIATTAAYCNGKPGPYYTNNEDIWRGQPQLVSVHEHGKLYTIGSGTTSMKLLHVYGTMYEMGYAQGVLLKTQLNAFINELWAYIVAQVTDGLPKKIPLFLKAKAADSAAVAALEFTFKITQPYTNRKYYEEMRGISEGSGVDFGLLKRIHMIGQLTKGACSMFGAWGKATSESQTVQLRALDWDFDGPYRKYPLAVVYHPSSAKYGNAWMNIGFMGWIGVLSGVNEHQLAVSQIGVSYPDDTFGKESRVGNPFTFVLRDVLQWDSSLQESVKRMQTTKRTCNLILGVGDGKSEFRGFQYSHSVLNVVDDKKALPVNDTWHPVIENAVYWGMDWNCPNFHVRLSEMLNKYHGQIDAENTIRYIVPGLNSGNLQVVVYDLTKEWVYFAYGYVDPNNNKIDAYKRPFIGLNLKQMFAQK